jgi:hypothetical protein
MSEDFKPLDCNGAELIAKAIGSSPSKFCDFTPFVILMWQKYYKTEYVLDEKNLYLKLFLDKSVHYAVFSKDIEKAVYFLFDKTGEETLSLSLVTEEDTERLSREFLTEEIYTNDAWSDYIYRYDDLVEMKGKRFSGQRNHLNKFFQNNPDWRFQEINGENVGRVRDFFSELIGDKSTLSESALFEAEMVESYLSGGYHCFKTAGGFVEAGGKIVAFAFGEVLGDTLFVHIEKARRDVQGAYQIIVREFAKNNPAKFINREEDMGIEGLRRSKESYHPIEKAKKYSLKAKKKGL